jgi:N-acetyl-anhydromuramyl-L-alanine amidase AmpD
MKKQTHWLFEAPLIMQRTQYPKYGYSRLETEWESPSGADYPAAEWIPAATANFTRWTNNSLRPIDRIVIHITDGPTIGSTINWFKNPQSKVSSHYVVGQDGRIVQMVKHNDIAYHASSANPSSIGIEHVACTGRDKRICPTVLPPSQAQLCSSAALVNWLCAGFGIPMDRQHILGHAEAAGTTHGCPSSLWNWDYYMQLVTSGSCF